MWARGSAELFFELRLEDIRRAARILRTPHRRSGGGDGFVSFACTPELADDTDGTVEQALELWRRLDLPNVMIKVPRRRRAYRRSRSRPREVNVNGTLLFSLRRYKQVIEAYLRGLERRAERGGALEGLASVASFFVSRVDAKAEAALPEDSPLRGRVAIANAHRAYGRYLERFQGSRWESLAALGASSQRPLWASTGTKHCAYSDVLYFERLIAPGVVNTMPEATA